MSRKYKTTVSPFGETIIIFEENGYRNSFLDPSPGNSDWQEFQQWLAEGNEPEPLDSGSNK